MVYVPLCSQESTFEEDSEEVVLVKNESHERHAKLVQQAIVHARAEIIDLQNESNRLMMFEPSSTDIIKKNLEHILEEYKHLKSLMEQAKHCTRRLDNDSAFIDAVLEQKTYPTGTAGWFFTSPQGKENSVSQSIPRKRPSGSSSNATRTLLANISPPSPASQHLQQSRQEKRQSHRLPPTKKARRNVQTESIAFSTPSNALSFQSTAKVLANQFCGLGLVSAEKKFVTAEKTVSFTLSYQDGKRRQKSSRSISKKQPTMRAYRDEEAPLNDREASLKHRLALFFLVNKKSVVLRKGSLETWDEYFVRKYRKYAENNDMETILRDKLRDDFDGAELLQEDKCRMN